MVTAQQNQILALVPALNEEDTVADVVKSVRAHLGCPILVIDDGSTAAPVSLSGYSIVEADSLSAAKGLSNGHPYLSEGAGNFAIEIFEMTPAPFEN